MNRVEPIRDKRKIQAIKNLLKGSEKWRDYILFVLGINLGLRIGDLLELRVKDLFAEDGNVRERFEIIEQKTGKNNVVKINYKVKKALQMMVKKGFYKYQENYIIFHLNNEKDSIGRVQAYRIIQKWCRDVGLTNIKIGTHTLRKTWGYHAHKAGISIEIIQEKYKHSSTSTTREYLGIEQKDVGKAYDEVNL